MNCTKIGIAAIGASILFIPAAIVFASTPLCNKSDIRLVNSMREIAQPYHANLDKGGRMFAQWAGLEQRYVLQLNQGDSSKQVSLIKGLLTNGTSTLEWQMAGKGRSEMRHLVCVRFHAGRASCAREILSRQVNRSPESGERAG